MSDYNWDEDERITSLARRDLREAIRSVEQLVEDFPNEPRAWSLRSYVYEKDNDFHEALRSIKRSMDLSPLEPACSFEEAMLYARQQKYQNAISSADDCIHKSDKFSSNYYRQAATFIKAYSLIMSGFFYESIELITLIDEDYVCFINEVMTKRDLLELIDHQRPN